MALLVSCASSFLIAGASAAASGVEKAEVIANYARIVSAVYEDAFAGVKALQAQVAAFLTHPSEASLKAAREAYIAARKPYLQSEAFRFCEGPVDQMEGRINSWPIDENYIDYVDGAAGGVINQVAEYPTLSLELLESLNEKEGEKNICLGFHAIEFLLWGQDHSESGAGNRSYRDFVTGAEATAPNPERRRQYLQLATEHLVADLSSLAKAWAEGDSTNYRAWFLATAPHQALGKILHGMGTLGGVELAGERLTVPYETKEQEDEHSCFSDTTTLDVLYDTIGIQNVYYGRYVRSNGTIIEGPSVHALLLEMDPPLAADLAAKIDEGVAAAKMIPAPFDRAILGKDSSPGRQAIHRAIQALQAQSDPLARARGLLGKKETK